MQCSAARTPFRSIERFLIKAFAFADEIYWHADGTYSLFAALSCYECGFVEGRAVVAEFTYHPTTMTFTGACDLRHPHDCTTHEQTALVPAPGRVSLRR